MKLGRPELDGKPHPQFDRVVELVSRVKTSQDAYGYIWVLYDENDEAVKEFFQALDEVGFFQFWVTNKGWIVGVHQVIVYLVSGWLWLERGVTAAWGHIETHHRDHDPTNNRPDNLVLLSCQDHRIVSEACSTEHLGYVNYPEATPLNKRGRPIKNPKNFLANEVVKTYKASAFKLNRSLDLSHLDVLLNFAHDLYRNIVGFSSEVTKALVNVAKRMWKRGENVELIELMRFQWREEAEADPPDFFDSEGVESFASEGVERYDGYNKKIDLEFERLKETILGTQRRCS